MNDNEDISVFEQLATELAFVFDLDAIDEELADDIVSYLVDQGFVDYDTLKEVLSDGNDA